MPYKRNTDLSETVQELLPAHDQEISAMHIIQLGSSTISPKIERETGQGKKPPMLVWSAVKNEYKKDKSKKWIKK